MFADGKRAKQAAGEHAEAIAEEYLCAQGLQLIDKNYRCRYGEIDLICLDTRQPLTELVFVEVRYRRSARFGGALESIDAHKQRKIHLTASHFMQNQPTEKARSFGASRFDIIAISGPLSKPEVEWFEGVVFEA